MKKITKKRFGERLAKYGALSLAIAGVADATGQVVYTDVDPDFIGGSGASFAIDFDNDGVDDVTVLQSNNGNYDLVRVNAPAGNGVISVSAGGYVYASNLSYGASIGAAGVFNTDADLCAGPGYAGSQFCGAGEGYLGVEFEISGNTHYGWVRVDVANSANFMVLDFAYESTPGTSIDAGEKILSIDEQTIVGFNQFYNATTKQLTLTANEAFSNITLYNLLGQEVIAKNLSSNNEIVDMSVLKDGVYIGTANVNGQKATFKLIKR